MPPKRKRVMELTVSEDDNRSKISKKRYVSFLKKIECDYYKYKICVDGVYCGYCNFSFLNEPGSVYISGLGINEAYRNNGYGTMLLYEVFEDVYKIHNKTIVYLEDASSRYGRNDNIYRKIGMYYTSGSFDSSMRGNLRHILFGMHKQKKSICDKFLNGHYKRVDSHIVPS
jgi:ribosomal protein S18 acetylase RimI-like enzyme